jgi:hypothetical protein
LRESIREKVPAWSARLKEQTGALASAAAKTAELVKRIVEALTIRRMRDARYWRGVAKEAPEQTKDVKIRPEQNPRQKRKL